LVDTLRVRDAESRWESSMPRSKPPYGAEFWTEAVRLVHQPGNTITSVARDLGVSIEGLRRHVNLDAVDHGERAGLTSDERTELVRLRRENRTLRVEREILKKAAAFFARETDGTP
jgi:transposase